MIDDNTFIDQLREEFNSNIKSLFVTKMKIFLFLKNDEVYEFDRYHKNFITNSNLVQELCSEKILTLLKEKIIIYLLPMTGIFIPGVVTILVN
jgi:hypothetical protein